MYKPSDFTQSDPVNFYYYPKDESADEFEPLSDDEGVDTSEVLEENDEDDVVPMLEIDQAPCDEDYDNYDSERILQIDESIEEEAEDSGMLDHKFMLDLGNVYFTRYWHNTEGIFIQNFVAKYKFYTNYEVPY